MKLLAVWESGVYLGVNEHFTNKADAKRALLDRFYLLNLYEGNLLCKNKE